MSNDLDLVIKTLEYELNNRGIQIDKNKNNIIMNNYLEDKKEKDNLVNGGNINFNLDKKYYKNSKMNNQNYDLNQMKKQIENDLYQFILQLKVDTKRSLDYINNRITNLENQLLKVNSMNDKLRDILGKQSELENNNKLFDKKFNLINLNTIQFKENIENNKQLINEHSELINELNIKINNIKNDYSAFEIKHNGNYNNNINESKIINKINELYKSKENNINILSNNLYSKLNNYYDQTESKFESINSTIMEFKNRLDNADNNVNLLNDLPNIKSITTNMNEEIININSKIGEIINQQNKINNNHKNLENNINEFNSNLQQINSNIEEINKVNIENKNINNDLNDIKKNMNYMEKKINNLDNNFNDLDNNINENKSEIIQIKKNIGGKILNNNNNNNFNRNEFDLEIKNINEQLSELNSKINNNNNKGINDDEYNQKLKEMNDSFKISFQNMKKNIEVFNKEVIKLNEENQRLIEYISQRTIQNSKDVNGIVNDFNIVYEKLEKVNNNFKETNKYLIKIKELERKVKEIA
jgi:chromosome segregation ATPase